MRIDVIVFSQKGLAMKRSVPVHAQKIQMQIKPLKTNRLRFTTGEINVAGSKRLNRKLGPFAVIKILPQSLLVIRRRMASPSPGFMRGIVTQYESWSMASTLGLIASVEEEQSV